ncbi:DEAD/DEAH box helicase [uncultured Mucilaginibacter sp.]|uniref:DEAD/DEAH box helicase n=1 Tax=uncultured Mucilaginibacter sp. TaxID=797541 RepID=UPI0025D52C76|nr:DEAD/DEAH box helicase [uncultured Mucilaginibacter sp.]
MHSSNKTPDITNVIFDQEIFYGEDVKYFTDILEMTPIPSKSIIYKTVTGIGATYSELVSKRHSIIVLPHISIITNKIKDCQENQIQALGVHGGISKDDIFNYLSTCVGFAKILTTPKGLSKIIQLLKSCHLNGEPVGYKSLFFLLIDECHKLVQDASYRADMVEMMDLFFEFDRKAMISATPIPPSDPRFSKAEFKHIKVCPDYSYQMPISILATDSIINTLDEYFKSYQAECYCIFFNSVEGIKSIIKQLNIQSDYIIYCSKESSDLLKLAEEPNVSNEIGKFKRYNFFTSSFFNGLDIHMTVKPDILIVTDYGYRDHTLLDPFTDVLQILGRFRRTKQQKDNKEQAYRMATHINNAKHFTKPVSKEAALLQIEYSKFYYEHQLTLKASQYDHTFNDYINQQLKTIKPYSRLLKANGDFSHFLKDNYLDDERVKAYYKNTSTLLNAYTKTKLYIVTPMQPKKYDKEGLIKLQKKSIRYSANMNLRMANDLRDIEAYKGTEAYYVVRKEIEKLSPVITDAYDRLGFDRIRSLDFKIRPIRIDLLKLDIESKLNHFPLINLVYMTFRLNTKYTVNQVKEKLIKIFKKFNIEYKAKSTDVLRYFEYKETKKDEERAYIFLSKKLYQVSPRQHI